MDNDTGPLQDIELEVVEDVDQSQINTLNSGLKTYYHNLSGRHKGRVLATIKGFPGNVRVVSAWATEVHDNSNDPHIGSAVCYTFAVNTNGKDVRVLFDMRWKNAQKVALMFIYE